jgi:hypothetical protein
MNSSLRPGKTFASVIFSILILTASANALDDADYRRLDNLWDKALQLENDITDAQQGARGHAADCFEAIYSHVERTEMKIGFLTKLVAVASAMVDKSDEKTVLGMLKLEVKNFNKYIDGSRSYINKAAGICSENYAVAAKAQELLRIYDEASSLTRSILPP